VSQHLYLKGVTTLQYDPSRCTGCGLCEDVCPRRVFVLEEGTAVLTDKDLCMECGACAKNCAFGAITVRPGTGCAWAITMSRIRKTEVVCCD
jgi:ferredoxin